MSLTLSTRFMNSPSNTTSSATVTALLSLGSNLPCAGRSPQQLLQAAMESLGQLAIESQASSLYRSEPQDCPPGSGHFINAAMLLQLPSSISPQQLLALLQQIEVDFGRQRGPERNQARTLDIDIISFENQLLETDALTLPHPRATERRFVLLPLTEIAPKLVLPGQKSTIAELLAGLPDDASVQRLE